MQIALRHGFPDLARSFVEKGANGDVADEQRRTPLIEATILGDEILVAKLLEGGVDIDAQGKSYHKSCISNLQFNSRQMRTNGALCITQLLKVERI